MYKYKRKLGRFSVTLWDIKPDDGKDMFRSWKAEGVARVKLARLGCFTKHRICVEPSFAEVTYD